MKNILILIVLANFFVFAISFQSKAQCTAQTHDYVCPGERKAYTPEQFCLMETITGYVVDGGTILDYNAGHVTIKWDDNFSSGSVRAYGLNSSSPSIAILSHTGKIDTIICDNSMFTTHFRT